MALKNDAKFEEKLNLGSKNDMMNLLNFNASSGKSENFHFDVLHLSIAYKNSAKIHRIISHDTEKRSSLEENLTFCLKNDMKNFANFNPSSGKSENLHIDGLFLKNYVMLKLKKYRGHISWKLTYGFKNDISLMMNFHTTSWNIMLDQSSANVLAEGMCFLDKCIFWTKVAHQISTFWTFDCFSKVFQIPLIFETSFMKFSWNSNAKCTEWPQYSIWTHPFLMFPVFQKSLNPQLTTNKLVNSFVYHPCPSRLTSVIHLFIFL